MTSVREICNDLKMIAPLYLAEEWDNVGLLLGDESSEIQRVMTCLTLTTEVAAEAVATDTQLIVTHHPILFKPVRKISADTSEGRLIYELIQQKTAVYCPHTAWDNSATGINQQLAEMLQLKDIKPLRPRATADQVKLVTFVPESHLTQVRQSLWDAGAGVIGNYGNCSFSLRGTGTFYGSELTNPAVGRSGQLEHVEEIRLEVVCPANLMDRALSALRLSHPYEEPAVDVFTVKSHTDGGGSGRFGTFEKPLTLRAANQQIAEQLQRPQLQFVGDPEQMISRIGIACGAAAEFLRDAHRSECHAFLTGEARFHACLEAKELGIGLILPGHFATERFAMETLAQRLKQKFPQLAVAASKSEQDPIQTFSQDSQA